MNKAQNQDFSTITRFFLFAAGSDLKLLAACGDSEKNRQANIGAAVVFTALFAFAAMFFAISFISKNFVISILVALLWSGFIFTLDRFVVSSVRKSDKLSDNLLNYSPRIILAILISFTLSVPIEMKLFESEISVAREKVADQETITYQHRIDSLTREINAKEETMNTLDNLSVDSTALIQDQTKGYKDQITNNERKINQLRSEIQRNQAEAKAQIRLADQRQNRINDLSRRPNLTTEETKELRDKPRLVQRALTEAGRYEAKVKSLQTELSGLTDQNANLQDGITEVRNVGIAQMKESIQNAKNIITSNREKIQALTKEREVKKKAFTGFLANLKSLHAIDGMGFALWFIRFLFMVLELAPILNKILGNKDAYDRLLEKNDERIIRSPYETEDTSKNKNENYKKDPGVDNDLKTLKKALVDDAFSDLKQKMSTGQKADVPLVIKLYEQYGLDFDLQQLNQPEPIALLTDKSWYYDQIPTDFIRFEKNYNFIRKSQEQTMSGTWSVANKDKNALTTLIIKLQSHIINMDVLEVSHHELLLLDKKGIGHRFKVIKG